MMQIIKTRYAVMGALAMVCAMTSTTLPAQTAETPIVKETAVVPPLDTAAEVEREFWLNKLRSERLDDRAESINQWLGLITVLLGFFGIVVTLVSFLGFKRFRDIEAEARGYVKEIKKHKEQAKKDAHAIWQMTSKDTASPTKTEQVEKVAENIRQASDASYIGKTMANAHSLEEAGKTEDAINKWRSITNREGTIDDKVVAHAWFSIGYLYQKKKAKEDAIIAYDQALRLDKSNAVVYNNRGCMKGQLERYKEALQDFNEALRLDKNYTSAYNNRGIVKGALKQYKEATEDFNQALRLDKDNFAAYYNRGVNNYARGHIDDARADLQTAFSLAGDNEEARTEVLKRLQEIDYHKTE